MNTKKTRLKICNFFSFLWITFVKAAMRHFIKKCWNEWESTFSSAVGVVNPRVAFIRRKKYQFRIKKFSHFLTKIFKNFQFWRKMEEKLNNYTMVQGIWMRECGKKIGSRDEVVCEVCQYRYKKFTRKFSIFSVFWESLLKKPSWPPL